MSSSSNTLGGGDQTVQASPASTETTKEIDYEKWTWTQNVPGPEEEIDCECGRWFSTPTAKCPVCTAKEFKWTEAMMLKAGMAPLEDEEEEEEEEEETLMDCTIRQFIEHCVRVVLKKPDASKTKDVALSFTAREAIITVATEAEWKEFEERLAVWDFDEDKDGARTYYF